MTDSIQTTPDDVVDTVTDGDAQSDHQGTDSPTETYVVPVAHLVTRGKSAVVVQAIVDDSDPTNLHPDRWVLRNQALNPLAFRTGDEMLDASTWDDEDTALEAAGLFVEAWEEMREKALAADDVLRNLDLPGRQAKPGTSSAFPPGVGGEDISGQ